MTVEQDFRELTSMIKHSKANLERTKMEIALKKDLIVNKPQKSLEFINNDKINRNVRDTELRLTAAAPNKEQQQHIRGYQNSHYPFSFPSHRPFSSRPTTTAASAHNPGEILLNNKEACYLK